jgi:hypothetical protein
VAATYPTSIKSFLTYQDQPGDVNHIVPDPDKPGSTVDLTIDRSKVTNEIHDEVIAMEKTIGVPGKPTIPGLRSMASEIKYLYYNKSPGIVDPDNNAIYPLPLPSHNHLHTFLTGNSADVHPQYMRVDGGRSFSAPVTSPNASAGYQLVTLGQATSRGYLNSAQVTSTVQDALSDVSSYPVKGPAPQRYRMTGGHYYGLSDLNGNIRIDYSDAHFSGILSFVYMKNPYPGASTYGYTYQYEEDQLVLLEIDNNGAWIQFIEDIVVDRQAWVAMTWMAVGT